MAASLAKSLIALGSTNVIPIHPAVGIRLMHWTMAVQGSRLLALLIFLATVPIPSIAADQASLAELAKALNIHVWDYSIGLRGSFGYKDNVLLTHTNRQTSPLWDSGADIIFYRLPTSGWMFNSMASVEDTRYFGNNLDRDEQSVVAAAQLTRLFDSHWSSVLGANYAYQNQVLDLTAIQPGQSGAGRVVGNTLGGRWSAKADFTANWAEAEVGGTRQLLEFPLDSFWQFGPKLSLGHRFEDRADVSLSYSWNDLRYDTRQEATRVGLPLTNSLLRMVTQGMELSWHQVWDRNTRWHTTLGLSLWSDQDNGSGFFNSLQYSAAPKLEYRGAAWKLTLSLRASYYTYPVQTISSTSTALRDRTGLAAYAHIERELSKKVKVFFNYNLDASSSKVDIDDYRANTVSMGAELRF
jgi:hypothetical protein